MSAGSRSEGGGAEEGKEGRSMRVGARVRPGGPAGAWRWGGRWEEVSEGGARVLVLGGEVFVGLFWLAGEEVLFSWAVLNFD